MKDAKKDKSKGTKKSSKNKPKPNLKRKKIEIGLEDTNGDIEHPTKKKKLTYIPKEHQESEINNLRDVEILHKSNIFRLQIQEIIKETSHSSKTEGIINNWIESFIEWTKTLKNSKQYNINDLSWLEKLKIVYPLIEFPKEDTKLEPFLFVPPNIIKTVGSYQNGTSLYPISNVDLLAEIPKKSILASDWKNGRYFIKRTLYLCYFAYLLKKSLLIRTVEFSFRDNDPLKIFLIITPVWDSEISIDLKISLDVSPPSEHYKLERFLPDKNNVRSEWLINESFSCSTPYYNGSFLLDLKAMENNEFILENLIPHKSFQDAVKLLKIWIKQRNLHEGPGGVSGYLISFYIIYLSKLNKIFPTMSSYQIMRTSLVTLAASDWCKEGLMFEPNNEKHKEIQKLMHQYYEVVFLDPSGHANLCHQMSKNLFKRIKLEAAQAIQLMDSVSGFQELFIEKISEYLYFDEIIKIRSLDKLKNSLIETDSEVKRLEAEWYSYGLSQSMVLDLLQRAIGERCSLICPINKSPKSWPVSQSNPKKESTLSIGILLENFSTSFNVMTSGPAHGDPEVESFQQFWGDKVDLRRFKDGRICESILWIDKNTNVSTCQKRNIIKKIVAHIFELHLKLNEKDYSHLNCELMEIFNQQWSQKQQTTGEEPLREVATKFDALASNIISLKNLPISISSVLSLSASLRYTEAIPIEYANGYDLKWLKRNIDNLPYIRYVHPHEAIINLEMSNKWPNKYDAVQRIKKGFQLEIAHAIESQLNLQIRNHVDFFDVYKDGFIYRMRVAYYREPYLLRVRNLPDGKIIHESCPEADDLERQNVHLPQIATALLGVHQRFNSFGPSTRLAKRWLRSQFLDDDHFPDIVIDMLVASLFIAPGSLKAPQQPQVAFLRFLQLLSKTDLTLKPIIIDFNVEMTSEDISQAESQCSSRKRLSQGPPLFVATPWDLSGEMWTKDAPTAPVLLRVRGLAQRAYQLLIKNFSTDRLNFKNIFRHDTSGYDIVLEVDTNKIRCLAPDVDTNWENSMKSTQKPSKLMPIVGSNPVADFVQNLRDNFGELALFFYNPYNSKQIGIIFNKKTKGMMEMEKEKSEQKKTNKEEYTVFNIDLLLEDFLEMGKDIVSSSINNYCK